MLKVLTDNGMLLALDELVPYAHWITPEGMPKRFDTWFFLAAAPPEQAGAHDGKEFDGFHLGFAARGAGGRRKRPVQAAVSDHAQFDQARQASHREGRARGRHGQSKVVTVMPVMTKENGGRQLRIPAEAGYDGEVFEVGAVYNGSQAERIMNDLAEP